MWDPTIARQSTLNTTNNSIHKIKIYLVDITPSHIMVKCLHVGHVRSNHSEAVYTQHIKQFNPQNHNLLSQYYTISHLWSNVSISVMWDQTIAKQSTLNTSNNSIHKITIYLVDITPSHIMLKVSISVMWDPTIARQSTLNTTNNSTHKIKIYLVDITPSHIMVKCLHVGHVRSNHSEAVYTQHIKQFNPQNHNLLSRYYTISHYGQMSPSPSCEIQP